MHDLDHTDHTDRTDTSVSGYRLHLTSPTWTHGPAGTEPTASPAPQYHLWRPLPPGSGDLESLRREQPERRTGAWTLIEADDGLVRLTTDRTRSHHLLFTRAGDTWVISDDPEELRRHAPTWVRDEEAAERLAVRLVLPLGACHLPAFVILGIAPVVASVGMSMLSG